MQLKKVIIVFIFLFLTKLALAWEPEVMDRYFREGERLFSDGKYEQAIEKFEKFLDLYPNNIIVCDYIRKAREGLKKETSRLGKETIQLDKQRKYDEKIDRRFAPKIAQEEIARHKKEERLLVQQDKQRRLEEEALQARTKAKAEQDAKFKTETEKRNTMEMGQQDKAKRATEKALLARSQVKEKINQKAKLKTEKILKSQLSQKEKLEATARAQQEKGRQATIEALLASIKAQEKINQKAKMDTEKSLKTKLSPSPFTLKLKLNPR